LEKRVVKPTDTASSADRLKNKYPVMHPRMNIVIAGM
jgi:hypothetical protein